MNMKLNRCLRGFLSAKFAPPLHMWARLVPIGFCKFPQHYAFIARATAITWKQNSQRGMCYLVSQVLGKWATVSESFRHCGSYFEDAGNRVRCFLASIVGLNPYDYEPIMAVIRRHITAIFITTTIISGIDLWERPPVWIPVPIAST
jgi:hypothetical protein